MTARSSAAKGSAPTRWTALLSALAIAFTIAAPAPAFSQSEQRVVYVKKRVYDRNRARSRIVVVPRSFLDAGTEVLPGDRKFTDYAFPPTHQPLDVVTNTGGRVGWHRSPLPGPFDLPSNRNPFGW